MLITAAMLVSLILCFAFAGGALGQEITVFKQNPDDDGLGEPIRGVVVGVA